MFNEIRIYRMEDGTLKLKQTVSSREASLAFWKARMEELRTQVPRSLSIAKIRNIASARKRFKMEDMSNEDE